MKKNLFIKDKKFIHKLIDSGLIYPFKTSIKYKKNFFDNLIDVLNNRFEEWDFKLVKKRHYIKNFFIEYYVFDLRILYKRLNVRTPDNENEHEIKNLLVKLPLRVKGYRFYFDDLRGLRLSAAHEEIANYYSHSHLHKSKLLLEFASFCLGRQDSVFSFLNEKMITYNDINYIFTQIRIFLETESKIGTPYFKIKNLTYVIGRKKHTFSEILIQYLTLKEDIDFKIFKNYFTLTPSGKFFINSEGKNYLKNIIKEKGLYKLLVDVNGNSVSETIRYKTKPYKCENLYFNNKLYDKIKAYNSLKSFEKSKESSVIDYDKYNINDIVISELNNFILKNIFNYIKNYEKKENIRDRQEISINS